MNSVNLVRGYLAIATCLLSSTSHPKVCIPNENINKFQKNDPIISYFSFFRFFSRSTELKIQPALNSILIPSHFDLNNVSTSTSGVSQLLGSTPSSSAVASAVAGCSSDVTSSSTLLSGSTSDGGNAVVSSSSSTAVHSSAAAVGVVDLVTSSESPSSSNTNNPVSVAASSTTAWYMFQDTLPRSYPAPFILFSVDHLKYTSSSLLYDLKSMYQKMSMPLLEEWHGTQCQNWKKLELPSKKNRYCNVIVLKCTSIQIVRNWNWKKMRRMPKWWIKWNGPQKMYTSHIKFHVPSIR